MGDTKLGRVLPKNQHIQRKSLNFEFWINGKLSVSAKIWLSKSISYVKNHSNHSQFYSWKNTNLGAYFLLLTFFDEINFQITLLLKWCPISDDSLFIQNSKFNNYLWVCWFLCNNLINFVPPAWKLHNPYCHTLHRVQWQNRTVSWKNGLVAAIFSEWDDVVASFCLRTDPCLPRELREWNPL